MSIIQTVSSINAKIKSILETTFDTVSVEGESSNVTYHGSGHIYFSLKDDKSTISAVMFRGNASKLKFKLQKGNKVILHGGINLYEPRGQYQLIASTITPSGIGSLALAYKQLKDKLEQKGYFDKLNKKQLPDFPRSIVIITSLSGAALQDMLKVAQNRYRLISITVIDTIVQGENAGENIAQNIKQGDMLGADIMIIGRGGGSIEDLWGFNQEEVADAIYNAKTPIISAVGHEVDFVISDYVADKRAATPSNAMEIALPSTNDLLLNIDDIKNQIIQTYLNKLSLLQQTIINLQDNYKLNSYSAKINNQLEYINQLKERFNDTMILFYNSKKELVANLIQSYKNNNPKQKVKLGFAQITKNNLIVGLKELNKDDTIELFDGKTKLKSKII